MDSRSQTTPTPSDLGLRIRRRRLALGLSTAEVAERTGSSIERIEQIETGPFALTGGGLVRLARALDTDVDDLTSPRRPRTPHRAPIAPVLDPMRREECITLIDARDVGRIAYNRADELVVIPVNYCHLNGLIIFRTAADSGRAVRPGPGRVRAGRPRRRNARGLERPGERDRPSGHARGEPARPRPGGAVGRRHPRDLHGRRAPPHHRPTHPVRVSTRTTKGASPANVRDAGIKGRGLRPARLTVGVQVGALFTDTMSDLPSDQYVGTTASLCWELCSSCPRSAVAG